MTSQSLSGVASRSGVVVVVVVVVVEEAVTVVVVVGVVWSHWSREAQQGRQAPAPSFFHAKWQHACRDCWRSWDLRAARNPSDRSPHKLLFIRWGRCYIRTKVVTVDPLVLRSCPHCVAWTQPWLQMRPGTSCQIRGRPCTCSYEANYLSFAACCCEGICAGARLRRKVASSHKRGQICCCAPILRSFAGYCAVGCSENKAGCC